MADASFDAVIIGGGKEGLILGCYLGLNGMTVGIFERGNELGGSACTGPVPASGFLGNPHAEIMAFWMRRRALRCVGCSFWTKTTVCKA